MNKVEVFFEDIEPLELNLLSLNSNIKGLIINELKRIGDLSVVFCSDDYLLQINKQYLKHNYYTDIITFDYVEGKVISGDLFISLDRIKENAIKFKVELLHELLRVVLHGVLHLVGYNDKTDEEQRIMREKENYYLSRVDLSEMEL